MNFTTTFDGVRQTKKVSIRCKGCGKRLNRALSESYFRNGLHDEAVTRTKNRELLEGRAAELIRDGCLCKRCEDKRDGKPVLQKKGENYEAFTRDDPPRCLGLIHKLVNGGWAKWTTTVNRKKSWHRTLDDAAERLAKEQK